MVEVLEVLPEEMSPEERVTRMRGLLEEAVTGDMSDVEALGQFIDLYEAHDIPPEARNAFYESLDLPEHRVVFGEDTFDLIVEQYDALGGAPRHNMPRGLPAVPSELENVLGRAYVAVASAQLFMNPGTQFGPYERFLEEDLQPDPASIPAEVRPVQVKNALSFMRSVELSWADHIDIPRQDYPDEFTDEQWEQMRKDNVVTAGQINAAWALLLEGNVALITALDCLEADEAFDRNKWTPWDDETQLEDGNLGNWEYHAEKCDRFRDKVAPLIAELTK